MTTQIAVRLPDELVGWLDSEVREGETTSRAALVERALRHERRKIAAERDAAIYATTDDDPELAAMTAHAAGISLADLD